MKKVLIILIMLFTSSFIFAQKFDESERLKNGEITLFDDYISDLSLAKMDNAELRILRNMIYAKYGHSFKSSDLTSFFSQFEWYKPCRKVDESEFTEIEKYLLQRIQVFETRNESIQSISFGKEIIGLWHNTPVMPATWSDRFLIYPGKRIEFLVSNFIEDAEVIEYLGNYEIKGNVLVFIVDRMVTKKETLSLKKTVELRFPIFPVEEVVFGNVELTRKMLQIGSFEYFLYDDDPDTMGVWSRKG